MIDQNKLLEQYISTIIPKDYGKTKKLFAIGFIGTTGVGKSTVAKHLSEIINLPIVENDQIRRFLNSVGIDNVETNESNWGVMKYIAENSSDYLYSRHISHIIDNDLIKFYKIARERAQNYSAELIIIKLTCPESVILKRLEKRTHDILVNNSTNNSRAGIDAYQQRKLLHQSITIPKSEYFMTIDTSLDITNQSANLHAKLLKLNYI